MTDIINMPNGSPDLTDHNALITLVESVKNIKESQEKFHNDIKAQINELKDNFVDRLNTVESIQRNSDKVFAAKAEQDKINDALVLRITWLERIAYGGIGVIAFIQFYFNVIKK